MAKKPIPAFKDAATLTIKGASKLTKTRRREMAKWLREQAREIVEHGDTFATVRVEAYRIYNDI